MPLKFRWPFSWPRRPRPARANPAAQAAAPLGGNPEPPVVVPPSAAPETTSPVQLAHAAPPPEPAIATAADGPDLGLQLLERLPRLATPPTLGWLGGLPAMAQTLPTVERFMQKLPMPPPQRLLPALSGADRFAESLPTLAGFTAPGRPQGQPAFPAQLEPPSEPTDVLAPPGGTPGQVAGLSGSAPILAPTRAPPAAPQVVVVPATTAPMAPTGPTPASVQRASAPTAAPSWPGAQAPVAATFPGVRPPFFGEAIATGTAVARPAAPLSQVLPPELTLTGNILVAPEAVPVQRQVLTAAEEEWTAPAEFVQAPEQAGERVSPEQRETIENQRGQGRPLEPEVRQRFEQAYGQPLDDVRVHTGPTAHSTAQSLNAIAFTTGQDLFFTQNTYAPESLEGLALIGHELAHVIQQQYGVAGDADELRPPDDRYERQADDLAARALIVPIPAPSSPSAPESGPTVVQRLREDERATLVTPLQLPTASTWTHDEQLSTAQHLGAEPGTLAGAVISPGRLRPEEEQVQPFKGANAGTILTQAAPAPESRTPALQNVSMRIGEATNELATPASKLSIGFDLAQSLPGLGHVIEAGAALPVLRSITRDLPGLGGLSDLTHRLPELVQPSLPDLSGLANRLPSAPSLGELAPTMPDLGGVAAGLAGGELPQTPGLPALGGLTPPEMPLAEGLGAATQAAGEAGSSALTAGQQALGTITSMAPSGAETPAAPPLPSLEKLTEHIWKEVQRKLKVERERSRGLA